MAAQREFPPSIEKTMFTLNRELTFIYIRWNFYNTLFSQEEVVDLLNRYSGTAFKIIQDALWDDVILAICRLADPDSMRGRSNLVLKSLIEAVREDTNEPLALQLESELAALIPLISDMRDWRNKRVAHNDHATMMARYSGASILAGVSRLTIKNALNRVGRMLNLVNEQYRSVGFRHDVNGTSLGGDELLFAIRRLDELERQAQS